MSTFDDLSNLTSGLFVDWYIPNYSEGPSVIPAVFRFSDYNRYIDFGEPLPSGVGGNAGYYPLQRLLTITPSKNQVATAGDGLNMTINAYEAGDYRDMDFFRNSRIEGSEVTIKRAFFDKDGELISLTGGNPVGRFKGYVETFTINDTYDIVTGKSDTIISLQIADYTGYLKNTTSGRKTARPYRGGFYTDDGVFYTDNAFSNVSKLSNTKFEWGKG